LSVTEEEADRLAIVELIRVDVVAYRLSVVIPVADALDSVVFPATFSVPEIVVEARDTVPVAYRFVVDRLDVDALDSED
jgi:hypothetical protein